MNEQLGIKFPDNNSSKDTNPIEPVKKPEYFTLEKIKEIRKQLIHDCKIGYEAQENLTFKKEELSENDIMSGWYIRKETLQEWNRLLSALDDLDDSQPNYSKNNH